jgi:hypothetical protein
MIEITVSSAFMAQDLYEIFEKDGVLCYKCVNVKLIQNLSETFTAGMIIPYCEIVQDVVTFKDENGDTLGVFKLLEEVQE